MSEEHEQLRKFYVCRAATFLYNNTSNNQINAQRSLIDAMRPHGLACYVLCVAMCMYVSSRYVVDISVCCERFF
jgi:hypothetical protein